MPDNFQGYEIVSSTKNFLVTYEDDFLALNEELAISYIHQPDLTRLEQLFSTEFQAVKTVDHGVLSCSLERRSSVKTRQPSILKRAEISLALSFAIFFLGALTENILHGHGIHGAWEWLDNVVCGLITGFMVFSYEQHRYAMVREKLHVIAAMNHHVRNALQPIMYLTGSTVLHKEQVELLRESVNRIQWALTDILPGEFDSLDVAMKNGSGSPAAQESKSE